MRIGPTASAQGSARPLNAPLAYLRAFIIGLVVAHHAAQGYNPILPPTTAASLSEHLSTLRAVSPVLDAQRSDLLSLFAAFNDCFFMSLLFLLSGLFVWNSLERKGGRGFLVDRVLRLGVPLVAMVLLRPLTYYPTYLQTGGSAGLAGFWQQWSAIEWRGGPIWFLEVLLLFDVAVVLLAAALRGRTRGAFSSLASDLRARPFRFFVVLVLVSALAYIPLTVAYTSFFWVQVGPAQIQVNRLLLYATYFLAGIILGAHGIERSFLVPTSRLARRWGLWTAAALVFFAVYIALAVGGAGEGLAAAFYVLTSATISFWLLAVFLRFCPRPKNVLDSAFHNSYGIYVIHYGVVSWLLFALLGAELPALAKWAVVSVLAYGICWGATAALRRIPGVARVL